MRQKLLVFAGVITLSVAMLVVLSGSEASAIFPNSKLLSLACSDDAIQQVRSAASDVLSKRWSDGEPFAASQVSATTLFAKDGVRSGGTTECRRLGIATQVQRIFSKGDPGVVKSDLSPVGRLAAANRQAYADAATAAKAPSVTVERHFARARALILDIDQIGFAIVPGGLATALDRIQTCLKGQVVKMVQSNLSLTLDCRDEAVRRALADTIAPGFYLAFRDQPAVNLSCGDLQAQAEGGATVEARWAAAKAFVSAPPRGCTEQTVEALTALATGGGSAELKAAAIRPLVELLVDGGGSSGVALADAWAAGLRLANGPTPAVGVLPNCNPKAGSLGDLYAYSLAHPADPTTIAPLARYYTATLDPHVNGGGCTFDLGAIQELLLTIAQKVPGAQLPLMSFVTSK